MEKVREEWEINLAWITDRNLTKLKLKILTRKIKLIKKISIIDFILKNKFLHLKSYVEKLIFTVTKNNLE